MNKLFAIDEKTEEVIVSESPKGSNKIHLIERIKRLDNPVLYTAVMTLTGISREADPDITIFKAMDKVCQLIYRRGKRVK